MKNVMITILIILMAVMSDVIEKEDGHVMILPLSSVLPSVEIGSLLDLRHVMMAINMTTLVVIRIVQVSLKDGNAQEGVIGVLQYVCLCVEMV